MACKVVNLIASVIYMIALLFILFSFEPKKMGGIYKLRKSDDMTWSGTAYNYPGEVLVHPFYISWTGNYDWDGDGELEEPEDWECLDRFGPTNPMDADNAGAAGTFGFRDGLLDHDSELPCIVSIVNATSRSKYAQRRYANYVFGASWQYDGDAVPPTYRYQSYGPRAFHKEDYAFSPGVNADTDLPEMYSQLTPNTWHTQDTVFQLCQSSGFFLAFGITFHILAFLMGGFIWNYSKCCCDFGICSFVFNAVVWSGLSLVCYLISICSFAAIFFQGREQEEHEDSGDLESWEWQWDMGEDERLEVVWSIGGALIITGMVFSAIAISLASYQWAKDKQEADDDKMEAAVEQAVRRASRGV